jgi:uncharacterized protein (TIGR00304 family)
MLDIVFIGMAIILAGLLVVFLASVVSDEPSEDREGRAHVKGGGVIMVGPIPVIFGSDSKWASVALVLATVLIVVVLLSGVLLGR